MTVERVGGTTITVDSCSILRDGHRWLPTMGEFHYTRYPQGEWRDELLKMQAGGIAIIATYVFWIHHEEVRGKWNWSGQRDLRAFVGICRELNFPVVLRIGPWCHGEVRNGGLPEWLLDCTAHPRTDEATYLAEVKRFYGQIAREVDGFWWKQGGPIVGIQIENEYHGPAAHLLALKRIAIEAGIDAAFYTRTAWPGLTTPMPFGHLLPLHGGYAEGFWDRSLDSMPGEYWREFVFRPPGENAAIATDIFGNRERRQADDRAYPYLTCELGGGMMSSYHRRIHIAAEDVATVALVKVGSGSDLPGYYMYHGGTNPESMAGGYLSEAQATRYTNYNDLPVRTYDFQAPLGECGQVRRSYHELRRLHLFLHDFGGRLAAMSPSFPADMPAGKGDLSKLRWSVRSDGRSGFVFVNNYQRGAAMPAKPGVRFELKLADGTPVAFPGASITVPAGVAFIWPFNLALGPGATLAYATAQLICRVVHDGVVTFIFAQTPGCPSDFVLALEGGRRHVVQDAKAALSPLVEQRLSDGSLCRIVLLDHAASLCCWKGHVGGVDRVVISEANVIFDGDVLRLRSDSTEQDGTVWLLPAPAGALLDGVFGRVELSWPGQAATSALEVELIRPAGPPRDIRLGSCGVAEAPDDAAFKDAAVWRITLPPRTDPARWPILRIRYIGDVARLYAGDALLDDNFYNGQPFEFAAWRIPSGSHRDLLLKILPLQDTPLIAYPPDAPRATEPRLLGVELIESQETTLRVEELSPR